MSWLFKGLTYRRFLPVSRSSVPFDDDAHHDDSCESSDILIWNMVLQSYSFVERVNAGESHKIHKHDDDDDCNVFAKIGIPDDDSAVCCFSEGKMPVVDEKVDTTVR